MKYFLVAFLWANVCYAGNIPTYDYRPPALTPNDPGTGGISFNTGSLTHVGGLSISETDALGDDLAAQIATWGDGNTFITMNDGYTGILSFKMIGPVVNNGSWDSIGLLFNSSWPIYPYPQFANGDALQVYTDAGAVVPEPRAWVLLIVGACCGLMCLTGTVVKRRLCTISTNISSAALRNSLTLSN